MRMIAVSLSLGWMGWTLADTGLTEGDFEDGYEDYQEELECGIGPPPPPMPCSVDIQEILELEVDLVDENVNFLEWVFADAVDEPACLGDVQSCHLSALAEIAPGYVPPSQGGEEGVYDFMPNQVGGYMGELTTCLTKDTNDGVPPPVRDADSLPKPTTIKTTPELGG